MAANWISTAGFDLLRRTARSTLDFVLPPQCLLCPNCTLDAGSLCPPCWARLEVIDEPRCNRLGSPFAFDPGGELESAAALINPPEWDRARAAVRFDDHSRQIVHALKYRDRHEAARVMSTMMTRAGNDILGDADIVVPVPLHRLRLWSRRYNQAGLLAQRIARSGKRPYRPDLLERTRSTKAQVGLGSKARRKNVQNAFTIPQTVLSDIFKRNVLLVDDVLTTGATANACAAALKQAGAGQVDVLVFALVLNPAQLHI